MFGWTITQKDRIYNINENSLAYAARSSHLTIQLEISGSKGRAFWSGWGGMASVLAFLHPNLEEEQQLTLSATPQRTTATTTPSPVVLRGHPTEAEQVAIAVAEKKLRRVLKRPASKVPMSQSNARAVPALTRTSKRSASLISPVKKGEMEARLLGQGRSSSLDHAPNNRMRTQHLHFRGHGAVSHQHPLEEAEGQEELSLVGGRAQSGSCWRGSMRSSRLAGNADPGSGAGGGSEMMSGQEATVMHCTCCPPGQVRMQCPSFPAVVVRVTLLVPRPEV